MSRGGLEFTVRAAKKKLGFEYHDAKFVLPRYGKTAHPVLDRGRCRPVLTLVDPLENDCDWLS